jgi:hypothetical protein
MELLKRYAGRRRMRFKEYRRITVMLSNGQRIEVNSPYFIKRASKNRRKKRGPNGTGRIYRSCQPGLLRDALQTALLCPSYAVASTVLKGRGIE